MRAYQITKSNSESVGLPNYTRKSQYATSTYSFLIRKLKALQVFFASHSVSVRYSKLIYMSKNIEKVSNIHILQYLTRI